MHTLLRQQNQSLAQLTSQLAQLDEQVRQAGQGKYNLFFFGPATGFAIGDKATAKNNPQSAALQPLLKQVLAHLNAQAQPPPPYSEADKATYLAAIIDKVGGQTIVLPYARPKATVPPTTCAKFMSPASRPFLGGGAQSESPVP